MKWMKSTIAAALLLSMLLSLPGIGSARAAETKIVQSEQALAFDPFSKTADVVYERHEEGYAVELDRRTDSVEVRVTAPANPSLRGAEKARVYVSTGVPLKAGTTYRVSFTLAAEQEQPSYAVCFDDGAAESAYGELGGRSIAAGEADQVRCLITPETEGGSLTVRLLLGDTAGNTLRFSGLAVEEADAEKEPVVLVDHLDYNAPGSVRLWTNADSSASVTADGESATLTVNKIPAAGAEVWKIKLLVATGLLPEAGKSYRIRADVESTASATYEVCWNSGETEKGYDVLYDQSLTGKPQKLERTIYVPRTMANPGELILQLSLGKVKAGNSVTVRNVTVEEASQRFTNLLPASFAYDKAGQSTYHETMLDALSVSDKTSDVNWGENVTVWGKGDYAGALTYQGETAKLDVKAGSKEPYHAIMHVDTGTQVVKNHTYRVSLALKTSETLTNYAVFYGSGLKANLYDNLSEYGALYNRVAKANVVAPVEFLFQAEKTDGLVVSLQVGAMDGKAGTAEVSGFKLEDLGTDYGAKALSTFAFNGNDYKNAWGWGDNQKADIAATYAELQVTKAADPWNANLCFQARGLEPRKSYLVSFDLAASEDYDGNMEIHYGARPFGEPEGGVADKAYGEGGVQIYSQRLTANTPVTVRRTIAAAANQDNVVVTIQAGGAKANVRASNFRVEEVTPTLRDTAAAPDYPMSFSAAGGKSSPENVVAANGSATLTVSNPDGVWETALRIRTGFVPADGKEYTLSFDITGDHSPKNWEASLNKGDNDDGDFKKLYYDDLGAIPTGGETKRVSASFLGDGVSELYVRLKLGAEAGVYTASNLTITPADAGDRVEQNLAPFKVGVRAEGGKNSGGTITGDGRSVTLVSTGDHSTNHDDPGWTWSDCWYRKLFVENITSLAKDKTYRVTYAIIADRDIYYEVCYNRDGAEAGFGRANGLPAGTETRTVTDYIHTVDAGRLDLQLNLGYAEAGTVITVSDISVQEVDAEGAVPPAGNTSGAVTSFGSVWAETASDAYRTTVQKKGDSTVFNITRAPSKSSAEWLDYSARLRIRTGTIPVPNQDYRVTFTITAQKAQKTFHVQYSGTEDDSYGADFNYSLAAGVPKTISHTFFGGESKGELVLRILLGLVDEPSGNSYTVSNVVVEKVVAGYVAGARTGTVSTGDITHETQPGYGAELTREKDSATIRITKAPEDGKEGWKSKMFINTHVLPNRNETVRVTFDLTAEQDMDFDVCYNRDSSEKGYDGIFNLHASAGKTMTVEKVFTAPDLNPGLLYVQLTLGMVSPPNAVTVKNLKVEHVGYSYPAGGARTVALNYREGSAVSVWAHEDYTATLSGADRVSVLDITRAPARNAEGWKIKLFTDTSVKPQPGKFYRVTADLSADKAQTFAFLCNNGAGEGGYNETWGLNLTPGETTHVDTVFSVPADLSKPDNIMLQINLGQTTKPNRVTLRGVRVEEVKLTYIDVMPAGFAYGSAVTNWTDTGCKANLTAGANSAALHVTEVPAGGAEIWQAQMAVNTGVTPAPGKTYLVRANLNAAKAQSFEVNLNSGSEEKAYGALYGQQLPAGGSAFEYVLNVPESMTDADTLLLNFLVGGPAANDITVSGVSVREMDYGVGGAADGAQSTVVEHGAGTLDVSREKLRYQLGEQGANSVTVGGAYLRAGERYTVAFRGKADEALSGTFRAVGSDGTAVLEQRFDLSETDKPFTFTTKRMGAQGLCDLVWAFDGQSGTAELSGVKVYSAAESLEITHDAQKVTFNGKTVTPDAYNINGSNYFRLRDLAAMFNDTYAGFVVRYNAQSNTVSVTTEKEYVPVGNELKVGADQSATCVRSPQSVLVNGGEVNLKAYNIGGNNYFRLRDLDDVLRFAVDYDEASNTAVLSSPLAPKAQEAAHSYDTFFLPEIDGESQAYVGDTMPFYDNGTYYIYYLKEGGDSYNHSVYLATTTDFVTYTETDDPVLSASRENAQDLWIGTGSVCKANGAYYFFYTGFDPSGSHEYRETILVAKGSSPTSFEKVKGWEITPPASLGQKTDFRDPQAYYDAESGKFYLTVTASQNGRARILGYTLDKDLQNPVYNGILFTDPTGEFYNLECSDTFQIGDKWYLTYSGQEDTLWYATADSRFGPYSEPTRLDGTLFYAAKHVEGSDGAYMVGWARRSDSVTDMSAVSGWGGNVAVQKLRQNADGSLALVPVDAIVSSFTKETAVPDVSLSAGAERKYQEAFTADESFLLRGEFTTDGKGTFGLAFDSNGEQSAYKLISLDPAAGKLSLAFMNGENPITETKAAIRSGEKHSFTYIQDGSVGIFYLDGQASLTVRLYGTTSWPIRLFAENGSVTFTSLRQYTR